MAEPTVFAGKGGFATLRAAQSGPRKGFVLEIANPQSKVNTLPPEALAEIGQALDAAEAGRGAQFLVLCGGQGKIHAGADVNMFAGGLDASGAEPPPDYARVDEYLRQGTALDVRVKKLSRKLTTVSAMAGERFGGSVEWPLMASYCVAAEDTGIQFSEVNIGFLPGWAGVLNALLRSGPANALYLGTTGARLDAAGMKRAGLVDALAAPDGLMKAALDLAGSAPTRRERPAAAALTAREELLTILSPRLDAARYARLREEFAAKAGGSDPKELSKAIDARLAALGRPVAPLAVESAFGLVARGAALDGSDLDALRTLAFDEAARCGALMRTRDRVLGVNSVLKARENPLNKIPVYTRS
jgi:enoyl-CoA hydratase/carnithine racemase